MKASVQIERERERNTMNRFWKLNNEHHTPQTNLETPNSTISLSLSLSLSFSLSLSLSLSHTYIYIYERERERRDSATYLNQQSATNLSGLRIKSKILDKETNLIAINIKKACI